MPGDASASQPKRDEDGRPLTFTSHLNRLGHRELTRHYGFVFDRRSWLLRSAKPRGVIAVRACARFVAWKNHAVKGFVTAQYLDEDFSLSPSWKLPQTYSAQVPTRESSDLEFVSYTISPPTECRVKATSTGVQSATWFSTPSLDRAAIDALESVQLFTHSYRTHFGQRPGTEDTPEARTAWFEVVCLEPSNAPLFEMKVKGNAIWHSHDNNTDELDDHHTPSSEQLFDVKYTLNPTSENGFPAGFANGPSGSPLR